MQIQIGIPLTLKTKAVLNLNCLYCEKPFKAFLRTKGRLPKYCSSSCCSKAAKRIIQLPCSFCGTTVIRKPSELVEQNKAFCNKRCYGNFKLRTPENLQEIKTQSDLRMWFKRANRLKQCERCGYNEYSAILQIHHKDRNRRNCKEANLEILCPNCHMIEHHVLSRNGFLPTTYNHKSPSSQ